MPLIELKTNLKSLKFGNDRPGGGSSNQPYIQTPIPEGDSSTFLSHGGPDFIIRGGALAPIKAVEDVSRLTQMFADFKNPRGILFTSKQNVLSRTSVETEATEGAGYGGGHINGGVYTPINTITQAGSGFAGTHLNLLGIDPTGLSDGGLNNYFDIVKDNNLDEKNIPPTTTTTFKLTPNPSYIPPPPSILGALPIYPPEEEDRFIKEEITKTTGGFSNRLLKIWDKKQINKSSLPIIKYPGGPGSDLGVGETLIPFADQRTGVNNTKINDIPEYDPLKTKNLKTTPSFYKEKKIEKRVLLGDPGKTGNNRYNKIKLPYSSLDKISALELYSSDSVNPKKPINDLVKFRIAAIKNDTSGESVYIHFRAFINSFSDGYTADWNATKYVGRGENLYNYTGFGRGIEMSFDVYAQSKPELIPIYKKLNYLASTLAPDYGSNGVMRGNMVKITMGGYLFEQPGFITSLNYTIPENATWDIAIDPSGNVDTSVKELPHMIKVQMSFTPIHNFLPQKVENITNNTKERYIALAADTGKSLYDTRKTGISAGNAIVVNAAGDSSTVDRSIAEVNQ